MKTSVLKWSLEKLYIQAIFMVAALCCALLFAAPQAHAATTLTSQQINAVTSLLQAFNVDAATVATVQSVLNGQTSVSTTNSSADTTGSTWSNDRMEGAKPAPMRVSQGVSVCGQFQRSLSRGDSGDDVSNLQNLLHDAGFLNASSTGYFGPMTEDALQKWQEHEGVVAAGIATSTGSGMFGPRTREHLMMACKAAASSTAVGSTTANGSGQAPTCSLTANNDHISAGDTVTLTWSSTNAVWASTADGQQGSTAGSVSVTPEETTTYVKRVYNAGGEGACTTTVLVGNDTTASPDAHVVMSPAINVASAISAVSVGLNVLWEEYLGLFR